MAAGLIRGIVPFENGYIVGLVQDCSTPCALASSGETEVLQ